MARLEKFAPTISGHAPSLTTSFDDCVDDYVLDRLPPAARTAFEAHLVVCVQCRTSVEQVEFLREALRIALPTSRGRPMNFEIQMFKDFLSDMGVEDTAKSSATGTAPAQYRGPARWAKKGSSDG